VGAGRKALAFTSARSGKPNVWLSASAHGGQRLTDVKTGVNSSSGRRRTQLPTRRRRVPRRKRKGDAGEDDAHVSMNS